MNVTTGVNSTAETCFVFEQLAKMMELDFIENLLKFRIVN